MNKSPFDVKVYDSGYLNVGDGHEMFYELSGNPEGVPVVYLHGGPGGCSTPAHKSLFDPKKYHIVTFDQRGCGKSKPIGLIKNNTTKNLIADIEKLRKHLAVDKWVVGGGSWGVTLSLLYAQAHANHVLAIGVSGVFLGEKREVEWLYHKEGVAQFFPEDYQRFADLVTEGVAKAPLPFMYELLQDKPFEDVKNISSAFVMREDYICAMQATLMARKVKRDAELALMTDVQRQVDADKQVLDYYHYALIVVHYMVNGLFVEEGQVLRDMNKISHIPLFIAQGRYDMVCPYESAYRLQKSHKNATLVCGVNAGHGLVEMLPELLKIYNEDIYNIVNV